MSQNADEWSEYLKGLSPEEAQAFLNGMKAVSQIMLDSMNRLDIKLSNTPKIEDDKLAELMQDAMRRSNLSLVAAIRTSMENTVAVLSERIEDE